jgi:hypothetical protein
MPNHGVRLPVICAASDAEVATPAPDGLLKPH